MIQVLRVFGINAHVKGNAKHDAATTMLHFSNSCNILTFFSLLFHTATVVTVSITLYLSEARFSPATNTLNKKDAYYISCECFHPLLKHLCRSYVACKALLTSSVPEKHIEIISWVHVLKVTERR